MGLLSKLLSGLTKLLGLTNKPLTDTNKTFVGDKVSSIVPQHDTQTGNESKTDQNNDHSKVNQDNASSNLQQPLNVDNNSTTELTDDKNDWNVNNGSDYFETDPNLEGGSRNKTDQISTDETETKSGQEVLSEQNKNFQRDRDNPAYEDSEYQSGIKPEKYYRKSFRDQKPKTAMENVDGNNIEENAEGFSVPRYTDRGGQAGGWRGSYTGGRRGAYYGTGAAGGYNTGREKYSTYIGNNPVSGDSYSTEGSAYHMGRESYSNGSGSYSARGGYNSGGPGYNIGRERYSVDGANYSGGGNYSTGGGNYSSGAGNYGTGGAEYSTGRGTHSPYRGNYGAGGNYGAEATEYKTGAGEFGVEPGSYSTGEGSYVPRGGHPRGFIRGFMRRSFNVSGMNQANIRSSLPEDQEELLINELKEFQRREPLVESKPPDPRLAAPLANRGYGTPVRDFDKETIPQ